MPLPVITYVDIKNVYKQTEKITKCGTMDVEEVLRNQLHSSEKSVEGKERADRKRTMRNRYTSRARAITKEIKCISARSM